MSVASIGVRFWAKERGLSTDALVEFWEERAAIREYLGGVARELAEEGAWSDLRVTFAPEEIEEP